MNFKPDQASRVDNKNNNFLSYRENQNYKKCFVSSQSFLQKDVIIIYMSSWNLQQRHTNKFDYNNVVWDKKLTMILPDSKTGLVSWQLKVWNKIIIFLKRWTNTSKGMEVNTCSEATGMKMYLSSIWFFLISFREKKDS